jgi:hypothetical protein
LAKRIGVLEPDQGLEDSPRSHVKRSIAQGMVRHLEAAWVVKNAIIQRLVIRARTAAKEIRAWINGPLGIGNLIPFARVQNKDIAPARYHYEIPHAGDRGIFRRHFRKKIRVSARSGSLHAAFLSMRTHTNASLASPIAQR